MVINEKQQFESLDSQVIWQIEPKNYKIEDVAQYDRAFLIRLVKYLHAKNRELRNVIYVKAPNSNSKKRVRKD